MPNKPSYTIRSRPGNFQTREEGDELIISCYFSVFGEKYELWPGEFETIAPTAFDDIEGEDIRALIDHETRLVLGRTTAGTLMLRPDEKGLYGEITINRNDTDAMNLYARNQRGDVNQCSFGFDPIDIEYITQADGTVLDVVRKVKLYEVSIVTFPAYESTTASARSASDEARHAEHLKRWKNQMKEKNHHG